MLATDLALALDPALVLHRQGHAPDPWQRRLLRSSASRVLLNITRQGGKSSTVAALAAHTAAYTAGSLTLCHSPSQRQSGELFRKVKDALGAIGVAGDDLPEDNALSVRLANRSRVVSLPGKEQTVRGFSGATLLLIDEAARVPDALYFSIRPMLAVSRGRLVALSTPWGRRGWFAAAWHSAESWERFEVPAPQCPRIGAEFLAEEERNMGAYWYQQEYLCRFLDPETSAFRTEDVERAFAEEVETWALTS